MMFCKKNLLLGSNTDIRALLKDAQVYLKREVCGAKAPYKLCSSEGCKIQARARGYVGRMGRRNAQRGSFAIAMDAQVKLKREVCA